MAWFKRLRSPISSIDEFLVYTDPAVIFRKYAVFFALFHSLWPC